MSRRARTPALILALLLALPAGRAAIAQPRPVQLSAEPVPMDRTHPEADHADGFGWAGGLWLKGPRDQGFGGLSDLKVDAKGRLIAVSDEGALFRAGLALDANGRLSGLQDPTLEPLTGEDGAPLTHKVDADAEGLAEWPNGDLMVSFEHRHRIWLYPARGGRPRTLPMPHVSMPANEGMEGLSLAPSQGADAYWVGVEHGSVWLCRRSADCERWKGMPGPGLGCRLSALNEAPGRRLLLLHHCYNPITGRSHVRVMVLAIPASPKDAPAELAELKISPPMTVDNLEGVAVVRGPSGGLRMYLISDDNFSDLQRTLLLAYDLPQEGAARRR